MNSTGPQQRVEESVDGLTEHGTVGDLGLVIGGPLASLGDLAARAESAGFGSLWLHEAGHDVTVAATIATQATTRVRIGTDVSVAFARTPTLAAFGAWDLQELSGGRFALGLGSQVRVIVEEGFGAEFRPPAARMGEYLQVLHATFATMQGEPTPFEGDYYQITRPAPYTVPAPDRPAPPVLLAAVGPLMTRTAARHADGIMGHPFTTPDFVTGHLLPRVHEALEQTGRDRSSFEVTTGTIVEVDEDRDQARRQARRQVAFYGSTPNYRQVFAVNGDAHLLEDCRDALRSGGLTDLHRAIPDRVLDHYAIAGTPVEVRTRLADWRGLVDHLILTPAWADRSGGEVVAATDRVISALRQPV